MALYDLGDDVLERAIEVFCELYETRLTPDSAQDTPQLWGELRSLCQRLLTGAEQWSEWGPLFDAFPVSEQQAILAYMAAQWTLPVSSYTDLEGAFCFEVLRAQIQTLRDTHDLRVMLPALGEKAMIAWESQAGSRLAEPLRTFVTEVSAGAELFYEYGLFNFADYHEDTAKLRAHSDTMSQQEFDDGWPQNLTFLASALERFDSNSPPELLSIEDVRHDTPETLDHAGSCITVGWYFEGNHGDWVNLYVTSGPMAGHIVTIDSLTHSGPNQEHMKFSCQRVMPWLLYRYYDLCLGEDVWCQTDLNFYG